MVVTVMTIAHNDHDLLPFFVRHYRPIADRIIVYDNASTDDTAELARGMGCEVIPILDSNGELRDWWNCSMKAAAGYNFGGDWMIVPDTDEFIYHPDLRALLISYDHHGVTLPCIAGYSMVGDGLITDGLLTDQVKCGVPDYLYDKFIIYKSTLRLLYRPGAHSVKARTAVMSETAAIKLLHYKYAFGREWVRTRTASLRMSPEDAAAGWGRDGRDAASVAFHLALYDTYCLNRVQVIP